MTREHHYAVDVVWTGNTGAGTGSIRSYGRDHEITADGPAPIAGSSDPAFRGDPARWNPEQLFVVSLAQCHMLWYLGLAAAAGVVVVAYADSPVGLMVEEADGSGRFAHVTLRPRVTISERSDLATALALHDRVGDYCFIARSVSIPVLHEPTVLVVPSPDERSPDERSPDERSPDHR